MTRWIITNSSTRVGPERIFGARFYKTRKAAREEQKQLESAYYWDRIVKVTFHEPAGPRERRDLNGGA